MAIKEPILLELPLPIITNRLTIRPVMPGDGSIVFDMLEESRQELQYWFSWVKNVSSIEDCEKTARIFYADFILKKELNFLIFKDLRLIGNCSFHDLNFAIPAASIGYYLRSSEQRKGYMYEAIKELVLYGFNIIGFKKLLIICNKKNTRSTLLAQKLGFELEMEAKGLLPNAPGIDNESNSLQVSLLYARYDTNGLA
ncbi:MAG: N-acetyltransferase [Rickettsiaceae bacterium]|nr:MAG: N-acetyltransferase [Rickettsiaceae bacterium]